MRRLKALAGAMLLSSAAAGAMSPSEAAEWPTKPIRLVVPFLAGGAADVVGRNFAEVIGADIGQQLVVENRTGGGGLPASEAVARADPDGYTLIVSGIASHILARDFAKTPPFDAVKDFTHIAYFGGTPDVFAVHPASGIKTFAELVAAGKASKEGVQYVSPGIGSGGHVAAELLALKTGMKLAHVPYRGGGGAIIDLIAGHVTLGSMTMSTMGEHIKAGALVPLGVTTRKRLDDFSNLQTLTELGYPDLVALTWFGLSGPPGLPQDVVSKLSRAAMAAYDKPALQTALKRQAFVGEAMTPEQYTAFVQSEVDKWGPVVKAITLPR